jgi:hypothetical protein
MRVPADGQKQGPLTNQRRHPTLDYVSGGHGLQPGDPAKAAEAILAALDAEEPRLRLVLGGTRSTTFALASIS